MSPEQIAHYETGGKAIAFCGALILCAAIGMIIYVWRSIK